MALHYDGEIQIKKLELGPYTTNCYIVVCPKTRESVIIDTPAEVAKILAAAKGTTVKYILITHTHSDHLEAFQQVRSATGAPVGVHPLEAAGLPSRPDLLLEDGDAVSFGAVSLKAIHTPGHSPGSICLLSGKHLFSGDTLFPGGPGHTASTAALVQILDSIARRLFALPDDTLVYPGHGPDTVLGKERKEYSIFAHRPHRPGLCGDVLWLSS